MTPKPWSEETRRRYLRRREMAAQSWKRHLEKDEAAKAVVEAARLVVNGAEFGPLQEALVAYDALVRRHIS